MGAPGGGARAVQASARAPSSPRRRRRLARTHTTSQPHLQATTNLTDQACTAPQTMPSYRSCQQCPQKPSLVSISSALCTTKPHLLSFGHARRRTGSAPPLKHARWHAGRSTAASAAQEQAPSQHTASLGAPTTRRWRPSGSEADTSTSGVNASARASTGPSACSRERCDTHSGRSGLRSAAASAGTSAPTCSRPPPARALALGWNRRGSGQEAGGLAVCALLVPSQTLPHKHASCFYTPFTNNEGARDSETADMGITVAA